VVGLGLSQLFYDIYSTTFTVGFPDKTSSIQLSVLILAFTIVWHTHAWRLLSSAHIPVNAYMLALLTALFHPACIMYVFILHHFSRSTPSGFEKYFNVLVAWLAWIFLLVA